MTRMGGSTIAPLIVGFARLVTGVQASWQAGAAPAVPTVYFANHSSHGDFVLLWATLPADLRAVTRPVAGADYWLSGRIRRYVSEHVFRSVLIDRLRNAEAADGTDPVQRMVTALNAGDSLIVFPEGTRNTGDDPLLPFKSGLFHIAGHCPDVRLVPVWIDNLRRVLPKGMWLPLPLACTVNYGEALVRVAGESKAAFLDRARQALLDLRPEHQRAEED